MLSAVVLAPPYSAHDGSAAPAVVRTFAALLPGTVAGLVRDVTLVAAGEDEGIREVADYAGCRLVEKAPFGPAFAQALEGTKQPNLFVVRAGVAFDRSFVDEVATLLGPDGGMGLRTTLLRQTPEGLAARLLPDLAPVAGIIVAKARMKGQVTDFAALVRQAGKGRTLACRAVFAA